MQGGGGQERDEGEEDVEEGVDRGGDAETGEYADAGGEPGVEEELDGDGDDADDGEKGSYCFWGYFCSR